jgi:hypothetical protein
MFAEPFRESRIPSFVVDDFGGPTRSWVGVYKLAYPPFLHFRRDDVERYEPLAVCLKCCVV